MDIFKNIAIFDGKITRVKEKKRLTCYIVIYIHVSFYIFAAGRL